MPVGRGGERRAIALANPCLGGRPFATPTLWAAIQYLMPGEDAPEHRHTQHAFRFVVEGEGVWTVVGGDPVADAARRLPAAGRLELARPPQRDRRADGVDRRARHPVPVRHRGAVLRVRPRRRSPTPSGPPPTAPARSGCGAIPGLRPLSATDADAGLAAAGLQVGGHRPRARRPARASRPRATAARSSPATPPSASPTRRPARDVLPTIRAEMHRVAPRRRDRARPRDRLVASTRCSTAPAPSPSATRPGRSPAATCSSSRRGSRSPPAPRPARPTPTPAPSTSSASPTRPSSRRSSSTASSPDQQGQLMKLATIRTRRGHPGGPRRRRRARRPRRRRRRRAAWRGRTGAIAAAPADAARRTSVAGRRLRPRRAAPVEGRLRRAQLPQPHPGDGPRPPGVPDALPEVRRHPHRRPRRHRQARRDRRARLGGRARRRHRHAGAPGRPRTRPPTRSPASR